MAYALIGAVIKSLAPYVLEEYATFKSVNKHAKELSEKLIAIHATLKDAEKKQITSLAVKVWLQKLTDAAHILDNILDKCSIISEANRDNNCIFHPEMLLVRRSIGKKMKKVAKKIDDIFKDSVNNILVSGIQERHLEEDEWRQTISKSTEPQIYGRDEDWEKVVKFLLRPDGDREELSVYSIVGHGGYGKTALAQLVFNDKRVNDHFDLKIWVCVSNDFLIEKILQQIIESITGINSNLSTLESKQIQVQKILQDKKYLLVLDDVWNEDQLIWNKFKSSLQHGNGAKGASVLVTTRLDTVVDTVKTVAEFEAAPEIPTTDDTTIHRLLRLSDDYIRYLFKQKAFGDNREWPQELLTIGEELVKKCVGSPLAANVLGSLLSSTPVDVRQWLDIMESEIWNLYDNKIISALTLSYLHLDLLLRPCFTFCAVFPKDFVIVKEDLIHLWMANGFISSRRKLEMEHVGDEVWNKLYQRSFFQEVKTDEEGKVTFKMHDIFHDIASSVMGEQCLVSKAASLTNLPQRVRHVSCFNIDEQFKYNLIPKKNVKSLRTFLGFYPPKSNLGAFPSTTPLRALSISSYQLSALKNLIHLRYLELYQSDIKTLPESICCLRKLQTLKLELCEHLSSLPKKLTQLNDLRHLVIKECYSLASMSSRIGVLTHLRTLSIFIVGSEAGFGLAELRDLQLGGKLHIKGLENVSNERDAKEANLIAKKELSCLYLSWNSDADSQGSGTSDEQVLDALLHHTDENSQGSDTSVEQVLEALLPHTDANSQGSDTNAEQVLEALQPHTGLKYFGMKGYTGISIPNWMSNVSILEGLVNVTLYNCKNCKRLPPLGKLPCLTTLYVSGMRDVKYIDDDLYELANEKAFPSLKEMTLYDLPNLEKVLMTEGVEMLSQLSKLSIKGIPKLALPVLPSVENVYVSGETNDLSESNDDGASFLRGIAGSMTNIKELMIEEFGDLKVLPKKFKSLRFLQKLYISCCANLKSIPNEVFAGFSSLRVLSFALCGSLKSLPRSITNLTSLESLQITFCSNLIFPANMNMLTSLRIVRIFGEDKSGGLHNGIERIPSLQKLYLTSFPSLEALPDWLGGMTSLQTLEICGFPKLTSLPVNFQLLVNLQKLRISESPVLVNRCKKETGEDWQKIDRVPELELELESDVKPTTCEKIMSSWKTLKQCWRPHQDYYPFEDEFDRMVDEQ